jgi:nucleotide-binding universal stress UspA family protein
MLPIKTILHPTDFSERSEFAFRLACLLARDYGAKLVLVHVVENPTTIGGEGMMILPPAPDLEALRGELHHLRPIDPKVHVEYQLVEGEVANEIIRLSKETKSDVIVMGTHGRTGFGRLLLGSVAEQVLRRAPCPVVTVKSELTEGIAKEEPMAEIAGTVPAARRS